MPKSHKGSWTYPESFSQSLIEDFATFASRRSDVKGKYLSQHMLSKYADPKPALAVERSEAAIRKWKAVESRNARTNQRLLYDDHGERTVGGVSFDTLISLARDLIARVIGNTPPTHLFWGSFSGGASTSKRRGAGMVEQKFSGKQDVSSKCWDHVWPHIYCESLWTLLNPEALNPRFQEHSVLFTVPKTDTIDRVACKEPDYNMYLQKGVGDFIRRRLRKRVQIDINDQSINRNLAKVAKASGLATIDLSSASDSVTASLVMRLLPFQWYSYLDDIRVSTVMIGTHLHEMEMFSTMGNGFTFELETLIFWALTTSVVRLIGEVGRPSTVSVYGDDIIAPAYLFGPIRVLFNYCGFTINRFKSFWTGPFRESCGGHYHNGADITPFYIKRPVRTTHDLIRLLNRLRKWASENGSSAWCDNSVAPLWRKYAVHVPAPLWGGVDLDTNETLVSFIGAGNRLCVRSKVVSSDQLERGRYLSWLHSAHTRQRGLTESKTSVRFETSKYVVKRRKTDPRVFGMGRPLFAFELR